MRSHAVLSAMFGIMIGFLAGAGQSPAGVWLDGRIDYHLHSDEPIEAIGAISIDGMVNQVGSQSIFIEYPEAFEGNDDMLKWWFDSTNLDSNSPLDTHLLIPEHRFGAFTGSPIIETNDYSSAPNGFGAFGQDPDGMMTLLPEYQTTSMDMIHIVSSDMPNLSLKVRTSTQTYHVFILPWTIEGTCGYYITSPDSDFGNVRVGTTVTTEITTGRAGVCTCDFWVSDPDAELGEVFSFPAVEAPFTLDSADYFRSCRYSFSPQMRGPSSSQADCLDRGQADPKFGRLTFSGCGVGPVFDADQTPGTTLEFGELEPDSFFDVFTEIRNLTDDDELGDLTRLITHATIEGDVAGAFQLLDGEWCDLLVGQMDQLQLRFNAAGLAPGDYEAVLVIRTDVGAASGATDLGEDYSFPLHATVVPEPSTLTGLLGLLMLGNIFAWRRREYIIA